MFTWQRRHEDGTYLRVIADELTQKRVVGALKPLVSAASREWHYVRYVCDGRDELRCRWEAGAHVAVGARQAAFAAGAVEVLQETYVPEVFRYGGERGLECMHAAATYDSVAAADLWLRLTDGDELLAESAVAIAMILANMLGMGKRPQRCCERRSRRRG